MILIFIASECPGSAIFKMVWHSYGACVKSKSTFGQRVTLVLMGGGLIIIQKECQ